MRYRCCRFRRSAPTPRSRAARCRRPEGRRRRSPQHESRRRAGRRVAGSLSRPARRRRRRSWRHPGRPSHQPATPRNASATASGDPIPKPAPLVGSPSARSMTVCDHRRSSPNSPVAPLIERARTQTRWSTSDRRSTRAAPSVRTPAAMPRARAQSIAAQWPARSCRWPGTACPRPPLHNSRSSSNRSRLS